MFVRCSFGQRSQGSLISHARGAPCHHNQFGFDCYGIVELPYFRSLRPKILISGIRYDFTPAVVRERNYNPVHYVVTVELVVVQQTTLALTEDGGVVFLVMHRVLLDDLLEEKNCQFLPWRCSVTDASGCGPHRDNDFVVSISNPNATGRTQPEDARCPFVVDERNTSEIGPHIERDSQEL